MNTNINIAGKVLDWKISKQENYLSCLNNVWLDNLLLKPIQITLASVKLEINTGQF